MNYWKINIYVFKGCWWFPTLPAPPRRPQSIQCHLSLSRTPRCSPRQYITLSLFSIPLEDFFILHTFLLHLKLYTPSELAFSLLKSPYCSGRDSYIPKLHIPLHLPWLSEDIDPLCFLATLQGSTFFITLLHQSLRFHLAHYTSTLLHKAPHYIPLLPTTSQDSTCPTTNSHGCVPSITPCNQFPRLHISYYPSCTILQGSISKIYLPSKLALCVFTA